jgi:peptide/nickel transport system substrate-binding protein
MALLALASALAAPATWASAQGSDTSSPAASAPTRSPTREEFRSQLEAHYALEPVERQGGTLIDATVGEFRTLNPTVANDATSFTATGFVYEGLVGSSPIDGQPAPVGLADWWEIAPDGVTYTFHLNSDARWHDGTDLTAADVAFSFDAIADEQTGSAYTGLFRDTVAAYRVIDEDTFEVTSNGVLADFLIDLFVPIVPKHLWESVPFAEWASDPGSTGLDVSRVVGTGPFRFQEWVQGESIRFVRNDDYYGVVPALDTYILRTFPSTEAAINALQAGEVDIAGLSPAAVADIEQTEGLEVASYPVPAFTFYAYNLDPDKTTLFQDTAVRQALFYALDREAIVRDINLGYGVVAEGIHAASNFAYAPERLTTRYDFDPDHARALLAEAGWTDEDGNGVVEKAGQELRFELSYPTGDARTDQYVAYMQDAWAAIGVAMEPKPMEFTALVDVVSVTFDFDIAMLGFGETPAGNHFLMFDCDQYRVGFNLTRYCNPRVDELHDQARHELDREVRRELLIEVENLILADLPVAIVTYDEAIVGYTERLYNYFPGPYCGAGVSYLWLAE